MKSSRHPCETALDALPGKLLIGVSGGVDSMALLYALVATGRKPVVAHFDHGWRVDSATDAAIVKHVAKKLGLKFISGKMRAKKSDQRENVARTARYEFFLKTAKQLGLHDLVQAHHADDQVETYLMQLLRGTGANGSGMAATSPRSSLVIHRPWLHLWKKDIIAYARKHKLKWREDSTNTDTAYRRNRVRRRLLPYLQKQFGPQVAENLHRAAEIARAESEWLDTLCAKPASGAQLDAKTLRAAPIAQQRRTLLRWLQQRRVTNISFADIESVRAMLNDPSTAKVNLSANQHARRRAGKLFIDQTNTRFKV